MKANEIQVGRKYRAKVGGNLTTVRVDAIREVERFGGTDAYTGRAKWTDRPVYDVTNLTTGRRTTFRSAAKFRCAVRDTAADRYLERITGDAEVNPGTRPNECLNPELEVMLRQVSTKLNAEVKPAFSVAEVNARQGREMEEAIGPIPEDKRLVTPTPESEAFEAMFEI
jgi:hypothetical protein